MAHDNNPAGAALAILERRKNVAARYVRGATQWEIARAFEVDQKTISNDLAAIRKEWLAGAVRDMDEIKARELAKIDACEAEAWKAWTKSQENAEILRARMRGQESQTEKVSKGQAGDPRFLDVVLKCVEKRCQILGVYDEVFARQLADLRRQIEQLEREAADNNGDGPGGGAGGTPPAGAATGATPQGEGGGEAADGPEQVP
jgi:hypothetical protein